MALTLEQFFLTGRFHATRWNQSPFEDSHGEWPPSPYRLLRTLAARWFEYIRETGDRDEAARDGLLRDLAAADAPAFHLPANAGHTAAWPARGLKQYQPLGLEKSDKKLGEPWMLRDTTTLVVDGFAMLPPDVAVFWHWPTLDLAPVRLVLLDALLRRVTYFGRAESLCHLRRRDPTLPVPVPNCTLALGAGAGSPVLAPDSAVPLDVSLLLAHNDDARLRGRRIPPGTRWLRATRPPTVAVIPRPTPASVPRRRPINLVQFALGGRVFPPEKSWVQITERFRARVLGCLRQIITGRAEVSANELTREQHHAIRLMSGKEADGTPLRGHAHISYFLLSDRAGKPTRLLCHRVEPFTQDEENALLTASEWPLAWEYGNPDWLLRLVPLPTETPLPNDRDPFAAARRWRSLTLYVPPRHMFTANGKPKPGESVREQLMRGLSQIGVTAPLIAVEERGSRWVKAHFPRQGSDHQTNRDRRGYEVILTFSESVIGPLALGHSNHYGLGLFVPETLV